MPDERTPEEKMLDEAQAALENGDKGRARDLLTRLIKTNRDNIQYWLLMSASVETNKERIFCLNEALRVDPYNQLARRGLAALGAYPLDETLAVPLAFQKRNWEAALFSPVPQTKRTRRAVIQVGLAMVVLAVIVGAVTLAINFGRGAPAIELSFGFATPTIGPSVTFEATSSPVVRSVTPTFMGPTPLSMLLAVTYTPTPLYVNTPHNLEDYNRGLKMMKDGNWPLALISFQNAAAAAPASPDLFYYLAEVYRFQKKYPEAGRNYEKAIQVNPNFAPAYLGRAFFKLETNPKLADTARTDVEKAISLDPSYFDAYLKLASIKIAAKDDKGALKDLASAAHLNSASALLYYERAQAQLLIDNTAQALADARLSMQLDQTFLPIYRVLSEALRAAGQIDQTQGLLETYTHYVTDDTQALLWLGQAYAQNDNLRAALSTFDQVLKLDAGSFDARLQRGLVELDLGDAKNAADDLRLAWQTNPNSFPATLGRARASLLTSDLVGANNLLDAATRLVQTDQDKAGVYYYRAQVMEALKNGQAAILAWQALLKLPPKGIPADWLTTANQHLQSLITPTPSPTR